MGTIVDALGTTVLTIVAAPRGLDVVVTEPVVHDSVHPSPVASGDVVLAVGVRADDREAADLIRHAGVRQAAAVAFKFPPEGPGLKDTAESSGVALLAVQPEMTWTQLASLLRTAVAKSGRVPETGAGVVPVGDLFALANAVAAMVGGPTTIEDPQSRILAFSSLDEPIDEARRQAILGRRVPETWVKRLHHHGIFRELWATDGPLRVEISLKGVRPRLAIAVRAGDEILGSIWVAEGRKRLGPEAEVALREAADIAALHLIRYRADEDINRRTRGDLLRSVLDGRGPVELTAARLGVEAKYPFTVIAFQLQSAEEAEVALKRERALDLVTLYCEAFGRHAACVCIDRTIYSLLPTADALKQSQLTALAQRVMASAQDSLHIALCAGIGSTVRDLRDVPVSRWEADQVLRVLAVHPRGVAVADIDEVRAHTILLELQDMAVERPRLKSGKLSTLVAHDAKRGTSYVETLQAYLQSFGDVAQAAERTHVHQNTFRYRLRRLIAISGIDLVDPDERLVTELQLRLL